MTSKEILQADLLDILFENRNKDYGAYALRKNYDRSMRTALLLMLLIIGIFSFFALNKRSNQIELPMPEIIPEVITVIIPSDPVEPEPPAKPPSSIKEFASVKSTTIIKIEKDVTVADVPDQQQLAEKIIDVVNVDGEIPQPGTSVMHPRLVDGNGAAPSKPTEEAIPDFKKEESGAEFPGGLLAFSRFLSKNLQAPGDLNPGEKKTVLVQFKVDEKGKISDIMIINSAGEKYDKEVIRVLNKMPAWKPAVQNGHKIAIYFKQPVSFLGIE